MLETLVNCPICNSTNLSLFKKIKDYSITGELFTITQCANCDFVFTNPRPDECTIARYYESPDYISHSNKKEGFLNRVYQVIRNYSLKRKLALISRYSESDKTILDLGCGTGTFLYECSLNGWIGEGIEPNKTARDNAFKEYKLIIKDEPAIIDFKPKSFQIITLWHVLEHVYHLKKRLDEISFILKDNGKIIIALPNYQSYDAAHYNQKWAAYDVPRHLYHFSGKSIRNLLEQFGYSCIESIPMKFDSYYVSILSEKYSKSNMPLVNGIISGLKSNLLAGKDPGKYSSVIYVFGKP